MKKVLVLGAGLVARPLVRYLLDHGFAVTVASRTASKARALVGDHAAGRALAADMKNPGIVDGLVKECDAVISLLPAAFHPDVARMALSHGRHMVTTSYVSPAMKALDGEAAAKGLLVLNEIGVDPGIDHMSAMRVIHAVEKGKGRVTGFRSYCGGLPAPEANTNPLGYKFSWNPRGVLLAATAPARYLRDGDLVEVPGPELFSDMHILEVGTLGSYEAYPNRDSLGYIDVYGLEGIRTMFRGTLRNLGHCDTWLRWARFGLFDKTERADLAGRTVRAVLAELAGAPDDAGLETAVAAKLGVAPDAPAVSKLAWLGLFSDAVVPAETSTVLDVLAGRMTATMGFEKGERDMLLLVHKFEAEYPGGKRERITSELIDFGVPGGDSSMSRTVSLPAAVATRLLLEGRIAERGVRIPVDPEIYGPVLEELETLDIVCRETTEEA